MNIGTINEAYRRSYVRNGVQMKPDKMAGVKETVKRHNAKIKQGETENGTKSLGQKHFLRLFVEQLKHQDPMNPVKDKDFIAQMATFSSLEHLNNMGKTMSGLQNAVGGQTAVSYIGRHITARVDEKSVSGEVSRVRFEKGEQKLYVKVQINGKTSEKSVSLDDITEVK